MASGSKSTLDKAVELLAKARNEGRAGCRFPRAVVDKAVILVGEIEVMQQRHLHEDWVAMNAAKIAAEEEAAKRLEALNASAERERLSDQEIKKLKEENRKLQLRLDNSKKVIVEQQQAMGVDASEHDRKAKILRETAARMMRSIEET